MCSRILCSLLSVTVLFKREREKKRKESTVQSFFSTGTMKLIQSKLNKFPPHPSSELSKFHFIYKVATNQPSDVRISNREINVISSLNILLCAVDDVKTLTVNTIF